MLWNKFGLVLRKAGCLRLGGNVLPPGEVLFWCRNSDDGSQSHLFSTFSTLAKGAAARPLADIIGWESGVEYAPSTRDRSQAS